MAAENAETLPGKLLPIIGWTEVAFEILVSACEGDKFCRMLVLLFNLFLSLFILVLCYIAVVAIVRSYSPPKKLERKTRSED